jgi:hypothetical protein
MFARGFGFVKSLSYINGIEIKVMTREEFNKKWFERDYPDTQEVLMIIASNLSDFQHEIYFSNPDEIGKKMNTLKEYIFDYKTVLRKEELESQKNGRTLMTQK